jgi:magnesium transporter
MPAFTRLVLPEIREVLESGDRAAIVDTFEAFHPADLADAVRLLEPKEAATLFESIEPKRTVGAFEHLDQGEQLALLATLGRPRVVGLLENMSPDDRADLVNRLPEETRDQVLPLLAQAERNDVRRLTSYEEGTAGSIMTTEYASLPQGLTVGEALARLRGIAPDRETIYYVYVTDEERRLLGVVSLRHLVLARPDRKLEEAMTRDPIRVLASDDQEEVARAMKKYDFLALPVANGEGKLVGIVTHDDVLDVVVEEATEDAYKFGAAGAPPPDYLAARPLEIVLRRLPWLAILVVAGTLTTFLLEGYQRELQAVVALAFFVPMLSGSGGNAGVQSSSVIIRGLATDEISFSGAWRVVRKELLVGVVLGAAVGIVGAVRVLVTEANLPLALTVASSMTVTVAFATSAGALLPLLFARIGVDPALVSSPLLTTGIDALAILVYFELARRLL